MDHPEDDGNASPNDITNNEKKQIYDVLVVPRFKDEGYWIMHDYPPAPELFEDKNVTMLLPSQVINEYKRKNVKGMVEPPVFEQNNGVMGQKEDEINWHQSFLDRNSFGRKRLKNRKARRKVRWMKWLKPKTPFACDILIVPRMWKTLCHFIWHRGQPTPEQLEHGNEPIFIPPRSHECQFILETGTHHYIDRTIVMEHVKNYLLSIKGDTSQEHRDKLEQFCGVKTTNKLHSSKQTSAKISPSVVDQLEKLHLDVEKEKHDEKPDDEPSVQEEDIPQKWQDLPPDQRRHEFVLRETRRITCLWEDSHSTDHVLRGAPWDLSWTIAEPIPPKPADFIWENQMFSDPPPDPLVHDLMDLIKDIWEEAEEASDEE